MFMGSLTLTLGNPKPMLFFVALVPTLMSLDALGLAGYIEIGTATAVILPATLSAYVLAAARARLWFHSARTRRFMNRGSGTLMAAAAAVAAR
jgi:threonine/homoserine/homoserine lactone efflux protein